MEWYQSASLFFIIGMVVGVFLRSRLDKRPPPA